MVGRFTTGIMALFLVVVLAAEKLAEAVESGGSPDPHLLRLAFRPSASDEQVEFVFKVANKWLQTILNSVSPKK